MLLIIFALAYAQYEVNVQGDIDPSVLSRFESKSKLKRYKNQVIKSSTSLHNRSITDVKFLKQLLNDVGYFNARVDYRLNPNRVDIIVDKKNQFLFGTLTLQAGDATPTAYRFFDVQENQPVQLKAIYQGQNQLMAYLKQHGYPFPEIKDTQLTLRHAQEKVDVLVTVHTGKRYKFGKVIIHNNVKVKDSVIYGKVAWHEGDLYNADLLDKTKRSLINTGIIATASIKPIPAQGDTVNIRIKITESPPRTISATLVYATHQALGGTLFWQHRNLQGHGEQLGVKLKHSRIYTYIDTQYNLPNLPHHFFLGNNFVWLKEDTKAYFARIISWQTQLKHKLMHHGRVGIGMKYEKGFVTQELAYLQKDTLVKNKSTFHPSFVSLILSAKWSNMNHFLNPTKGTQLKLEIQPHFAQKEKFTMITGSVSHLLQLYQNPISEKQLLWFNKVALSTLSSAKITDVVPYKRLYMGGTATMRAYGFKMVGDVDDVGTPLGGLSTVGWITELRYRITPKIGLHFYHEVGSLSQNNIIDAKFQTFFQGSGVTVCYYSKVAPIQIGFAVPWKRRKDYKGRHIDSFIQFYVGVGQIK